MSSESQEKKDVIKALECCVSEDRRTGGCNKCPYMNHDEACKSIKKVITNAIKRYRDENEALKSYIGGDSSEIEQYCNGFIAGKESEKKKKLVQFELYPPLK